MLADSGNGAARLFATDRYTVATFPVQVVEGELSPLKQGAVSGFMIPNAAAVWVAKTTAKGLRMVTLSREYRFRFEVESDEFGNVKTVTVSIVLDGKVERSQMFDGVGGNFHPVWRILDEFVPGEVASPFRLGAEHLGKILASAKVAGSRDEPVEFILCERMAGPIFWSVGRCVGLIQPNMPLKR